MSDMACRPTWFSELTFWSPQGKWVTNADYLLSWRLPYLPGIKRFKRLNAYRLFIIMRLFRVVVTEKCNLWIINVRCKQLYFINKREQFLTESVATVTVYSSV